MPVNELEETATMPVTTGSTPFSATDLQISDEVRRSHVLAVDDHPRSLWMLERILQDAGYEHVTATTDPLDALAGLEADAPDIVLLDLIMPDLDGFELIARIRSIVPDHVRLPIVAMTVDSSRSVRDRALSKGASDFVVKPFDATEVQLRIANLLATHYAHAALAARAEQLSRSNAALRAQETALEQLNHELEDRIAARTAELERSNSELVQFAHIASHDLREPIRAIADFAEILTEDADELTPHARDFVGEIRAGAARALTMMDALLEYARVDARELVRDHVEISDALDDASTDLRVVIEEAHATVTRGALPSVRGDAAQICLLFQNLLSNAIKFRGPDPPAIHVSGSSRGDLVEFRVTDNGIGLDTSEADRIFGLFERLHTRDRFDGAGIGLAVCRRIVERHGGEISVDSAPGPGATFCFTLTSHGQASGEG